MKIKTHLFWILSLSLTLALALAGCTPATKDAWQTIKDSGVLTVGTSPDYPPFETVDDDGNIIGFDVDLIQAMAEEMGITVEFKSMSFETIVTAVQSEQVNIGMAGFSIDPERDVDFSDPYYSGGQVLLTTTNSGITQASDLVGETIAVQMGTTCEKAAQTVEGAKITALDNFGVAILMLKNGTAKAVVADLGVAHDYVEKEGLIIVDEPLSVEDIAIVVKKGNTTVLEAINAALAKVKNSPIYEELIDKWGIDQEV